VAAQKVPEQGGKDERTDPGGDVIHHDAPPLGKTFERRYRPGFEDVEGAEETEGDEGKAPTGEGEAGREERGELASGFVDDHESGIVNTAGAGDVGGGWNSGDGGEESEQKREEKERMRRDVKEKREGKPE